MKGDRLILSTLAMLVLSAYAVAWLHREERASVPPDREWPEPSIRWGDEPQETPVTGPAD